MSNCSQGRNRELGQQGDNNNKGMAMMGTTLTGMGMGTTT